jgi:hypothetical protein
VPVIAWGLLTPDLLGTHLLQALRRTVAIVGIPLRNKALSYVTVNIKALRLNIGGVFTPHLRSLIPVKTQPPQGIKDSLHRPLNLAGDIGILNADDEATAVVAGKQPVKQSRPDIAHMGITGGAGSIAHSDGFSHLDLAFN